MAFEPIRLNRDLRPVEPDGLVGPVAAHRRPDLPHAPISMETAVHITYYTDPLCSWSWAFEPVWRRLRYEYGGPVAWRYVMGGMIPDWKTFSDPLNDVGRPSQMAPHWYHVSQASGQPIDVRIWHDDPPDSSFPACLAVKAAERQGSAASEATLRALREAAMRNCRNIARRETLRELTRELDAKDLLDADRFEEDYCGGEAEAAFREDLKDARYQRIGRFPTLVLAPSTGGRAIKIVGYRPYDVMRRALEHIAPGIAPVRNAPSAEEYTAFWGGATEREIEETQT